MGGEFKGLDDEDDGACIGFKSIGFVLLKYCTHASGEFYSGAGVLFYRHSAVDD